MFVGKISCKSPMKFPQKGSAKWSPTSPGVSEAISGGDGGTLQVLDLESQSCVQAQGDGDGENMAGWGLQPHIYHIFGGGLREVEPELEVYQPPNWELSKNTCR